MSDGNPFQVGDIVHMSLLPPGVADVTVKALGECEDGEQSVLGSPHTITFVDPMSGEEDEGHASEFNLVKRAEGLMADSIRWTGDNVDAVAEFLDAPARRDYTLYGRFGPAFSLPGADQPAIVWVTREQAWVNVEVGDEITRDGGEGRFVVTTQPATAKA